MRFTKERCGSGFQPEADPPLAETGTQNRPMSYYVYVLWSEILQKRYIGSTGNLNLRIAQHNRGCSRFTKPGIPWQLVYKEEYTTKTEARKRENFLKSGVGRNFLDQLLIDYRKGAGVVFSQRLIRLWRKLALRIDL